MRISKLIIIFAYFLFLQTDFLLAQNYYSSGPENEVIPQPKARGKFIGAIELPEYEGYCGQAAAVNMIALCPIPSCSKLAIPKFPNDMIPGTAPSTLLDWMNTHRICGRFTQRIIDDIVHVKVPALVLGFAGPTRAHMHWLSVEEIDHKANGDCFVQYVDGKRYRSTCVIFNLRYALSSNLQDLQLGVGQYLVLESSIKDSTYFDSNRGSKKCSPKICENSCKKFMGANATGSCSLVMESEGPLFDQRVCTCRDENRQTHKVNFFDDNRELCTSL